MNITAFLAAIFVMLSLLGCSANRHSEKVVKDPPPPTPTTAEEKSEEGPVIVDEVLQEGVGLDAKINTLKKVLAERGFHGEVGFALFLFDEPDVEDRKISIVRKVTAVLRDNEDLNFEDTGIQRIRLWIDKAGARRKVISRNGILDISDEDEEELLALLLAEIPAAREDYVFKGAVDDALVRVSELARERGYTGTLFRFRFGDEGTYRQRHNFAKKIESVMSNNPELSFEGTGIQNVRLHTTRAGGSFVYRNDLLDLADVPEEEAFAQLLKSGLDNVRRDYEFKSLVEQKINDLDQLVREMNYQGEPIRFISEDEGTYEEKHDFLERLQSVLQNNPGWDFKESDIKMIRLWTKSLRQTELNNEGTTLDIANNKSENGSQQELGVILGVPEMGIYDTVINFFSDLF